MHQILFTNAYHAGMRSPRQADFAQAVANVSALLAELARLQARIYPHMWGSSDGILYTCPWCKRTVSARDAQLGVYCEARHRMGGDALD